MKITNATARRYVRIGRALSVVLLVGSLVIGSLAWSHELYLLFGINAFLFGANAILGSINWFRFEL